MPPANPIDGQGEYLLGTEAPELERLFLQHEVWSAEAHALWDRAGFAPGMHLADLGCGPGFATVELASLAGSGGRVAAIDSSPRYLAHLRELLRALPLTNVDVIEGDVSTHRFRAESLDGAFARWLLCFLSDPAQLLANLLPSLRTGGAVVVQDYARYGDLTLAPRDPALDRVVRAVIASWEKSGGDLDVGSKLPEMMERSGLSVTVIEPLERVARPGSLTWEWMRRFFFNYMPRLVELGLLAPVEQQAFEAKWREREQTPGGFFFTPTMVGVIGLKR